MRVTASFSTGGASFESGKMRKYENIEKESAARSVAKEVFAVLLVK